MYVVSKRNIVLPGPGGEKFRMAKDFMGPVPAWAEGSAYLEALAADGKVILSDGKKAKRPKKPAKPSEEQRSDQPDGEQPPDKGGGQPAGEQGEAS